MWLPNGCGGRSWWWTNSYGRCSGILLWFRWYLDVLTVAQCLALIVWWVGAGLQPFMAACFVWGHTLLRIPSAKMCWIDYNWLLALIHTLEWMKYSLQASANEVNENRIIATQRLGQRLRAWSTFAVLRVGDAPWIASRIEEQTTSGCGANHVFWWHAQYFHNTGQLLHLILTREYRVAGVQLGQYASCKWDIHRSISKLSCCLFHLIYNCIVIFLPKLHMSIGVPYDRPRMTSGER